MLKLFANSGDLDQTPRSAASDLGLHCLPITILLVSRLQLVKNDLRYLILHTLHFGFYSNLTIAKIMISTVVSKNRSGAVPMQGHSHRV